MISIGSNIKSIWLLFFINPFTSVIVAFRNLRMPYAKNILWAFFVFYGLTYAIGEESKGSDINRYIEEYQQLSKEEMTLDRAVEYFESTGEIDVVRTILAIVVSRVSDSSPVLLMVYAFIFGYFYSRNIVFIAHLISIKLDWFSKLVFFALLLVLPIWLINGFRMWTAMQIFVFGLLHFFFGNRRKSYWAIYGAFLVHFSFILPMLIFTVFLLFKKQTTIFFVLFLFSLAFNSVNIQTLNRVIEGFAPAVFLERTESYRNEEKVEQVQRGEVRVGARWYAVWYNKLIHWVMYVFVVTTFLKSKNELRKRENQYSLFTFLLLYYSVANILSSLPSGLRFLKLALYLSLLLFLLLRKEDIISRRMLSKYKLTTPFFLLYIIVSLRIGTYTTSMMTIFGNPLFDMFMFGENISLNDLIK